MKNNETNGQPNRIEKSTKIKGNITSEADFRIDGTLEGSIVTSGKVVIGKDGYINGTVSCTYADIEGKLQREDCCQRKSFIKSIFSC
jgi:cytoskeletal protein CcmA (bactofilin family)